MDEKELNVNQELMKINRRLVKQNTIQAIAHCIEVALIVGILVISYFFSDYGYGVETVVQNQADGTEQSQTIVGGGNYEE